MYRRVYLLSNKSPYLLDLQITLTSTSSGFVVIQCRGRAERTARVVRMVPGPAFLANEFDILFEVRFHSRTHVSSYPSPTHLYLPGAISSPIDATLGH